MLTIALKATELSVLMSERRTEMTALTATELRGRWNVGETCLIRCEPGTALSRAKAHVMHDVDVMTATAQKKNRTRTSVVRHVALAVVGRLLLK